MSSASSVMNGYLPIALTLRILVTSVAPSASLTTMVATITFASSDLKVTVTSYFFFGPRVPKSGIKLQKAKEKRRREGAWQFEMGPTLSDIDREVLAI